MPIDALTPIPNNESSISMVNFFISFFLTRRLILLYNTYTALVDYSVEGGETHGRHQGNEAGDQDRK